MDALDVACRMCNGAARPVGTVKGKFSRRLFHLDECPRCGFVFVSDPWLEYRRIYDESYYRGRGADPLIDYCWEVEHPDAAVRSYEWRGIMRRVQSMQRDSSACRWLDYGCGTGGLVQYLVRNGIDAVGYESGWGGSRMRELGIPCVDEDALDGHQGAFDVVTAIEVLEHVADPIEVLSKIRSLLRPGGLLFLTTGNVDPYGARITKWSYVVPEIHISFYRPSTLARALTTAGFSPEFPGYGPGWSTIIRFKTLKGLRRRRRALWEAAVPWDLIGRLIDRRLELSAQPVGWAV